MSKVWQKITYGLINDIYVNKLDKLEISASYSSLNYWLELENKGGRRKEKNWASTIKNPWEKPIIRVR
jgi:hypothetical protein